MSKFYHVIRDHHSKWIQSPNNGGECCATHEDTVEALNQLIQERDALQARVTSLQRLLHQRWEMMRELEVVCETKDVAMAVEYIKGLKARVKRLEEAGDNLARRLKLWKMEDGWLCSGDEEAFKDWQETKEPKP